MPRVRRLALVLVLALAGSGSWACTPSTELRRVRTPREGVALDYQLPVGQGFEGNLRVGNTRAVEGLEAPLSQTATCDVNMVVLGQSPAGTEFRATFNNVDLDWDLPPSATYSSAELLELAGKRLRGMQVNFVVRPDGRVQALPTPPQDTPPELREVIETLLHGLEAFFVPLPPEPLRKRDPWNVQLSHETAGGLRLEMQQTLTLDSSYEHRDEEQSLQRLSVEQQRREQRPGESGPVMVERDARAQLMFAAGYPAELDREIREFDPVHGMVFRKVRAQWNRARGLAPELMAPPQTGDVQVISDPCNPDYVGPASCEDDDAKTDADDGSADDAKTDGTDAAGDAETDDTNAAGDAETDDTDATDEAKTDDADTSDEAKTDDATDDAEADDTDAASDAKAP